MGRARYLLVVHLLFVVEGLVVLRPHEIHVSFEDVLVLHYLLHFLPCDHPVRREYVCAKRPFTYKIIFTCSTQPCS